MAVVVTGRRLWLVRHGATEWSEAGRLCGWTDVPLSSSGRNQAEALRPRLHGQAFDSVWTSDLVRAAEFAELTMGGATPDRRLRELDFGELEGRIWPEIDRSTQDALRRFEGFAAPGGEAVTSLEDRVLGFLAGLGAGDHLVVTHGGVIMLLSRMRGLDGSPLPGELTVLDGDTVAARRRSRS